MTAGVVPTVRRGPRVLPSPAAAVPTASRVMVAWRAVHWPAVLPLRIAAGQVQVTAGVVPTVRWGPRVPPPAAAVPTARRTMVAWRAVHRPVVLPLRITAGQVQVTAGVVPNVRRGPRVPPPTAAVPTARQTMVAWRAVHRPVVLPLRIAAGQVQVTAGVVPTVRRGPRVPPPAAAVPTARRTMVAWRAVHWPAVLPLRIAAGQVQVTAGVVPTVRRGPRVLPSLAAAVPTARRTMVAWRAMHRPAVLPLRIAAGQVQVTAGVVPTVRRGTRVPPPAAAVPTAGRTMVAWRAVHWPAVLPLGIAAGQVQVTAGVVPTVRRRTRVLPSLAAAVPTARRTMVAWRAVHRLAVLSLRIAAGQVKVTAEEVPTVRRGPRVSPPAAAVPTARRTMVAWRAVHRPAAISLTVAAGQVKVTAGVVSTVRRAPRVPPPSAAVPTARRTMVAWRAVHWPVVLSLRIAAGQVQVSAGVVPTVRRGSRVPPPAIAVPTARRTMVAWRVVHRPAVLPFRFIAGQVQVATGVVPTVRRGSRVPSPAAAVPTARRTMAAWRAMHRPAVLPIRIAAGQVQVTAGMVPTVRRTMVAWRAVHRPAVLPLRIAAGQVQVMAIVVPTVRRGAKVLPSPAAAVPTARRVMVAWRAMHRSAVLPLRIAAGQVQVTAGVVSTVRRGPRVPPPAAAVPTARRTMVA